MADPEQPPNETPQDGSTRPEWLPGAWLVGAGWLVLSLLILLVSLGVEYEIREARGYPYARASDLWAMGWLHHLVVLVCAGLGVLVIRAGIRCERSNAGKPRCELCHSHIAAPGATCPTCKELPTDSSIEEELIASESESESDQWRRYLQARDVPCPNCRYNLRDGTTDRCPECGWRLSNRARKPIDRLPGEFWYPGVGRSNPRDTDPAWARRSAVLLCVIIMWPETWVPIWWIQALYSLGFANEVDPFVLLGTTIAFACICVFLLARVPTWSARTPAVDRFVAWLARPLVLIGLLVAVAAIAGAAVYLHK